MKWFSVNMHCIGSADGPGEHADWLRLSLSFRDFLWAAGNVAHAHRVPFDPDLFSGQFVPPGSIADLVRAFDRLGFAVTQHAVEAAALRGLKLPCVVVLRCCEPAPDESVCAAPANGAGDLLAGQPQLQIALVGTITDDRVALVTPDLSSPRILSAREFDALFTGFALEVVRRAAPLKDADSADEHRHGFGFRWFVPELLKHRGVWADVLAASLVLQLVALATPLLTQVIIDKVVVHQTVSTLVVIGVALGVFLAFGAILTWVRQYLVLHTGNRVDAVLGARAFEHLLRLPPRYFEHRPTGVIAARLQGIETIREFIASAAVTLVLDLPFLLVFVAVMFW